MVLRSATVPLVLTTLAVACGVMADAHTYTARLFHRGERPVAVGRTPTGVSSTTSEACASCHAEIAAEWRASQHHEAWVDPVFRAAYDTEPMPFCRHCHAPLAARGTMPNPRAAEEGVSCSVCHVRSGAVLGARHRTDTPHPVMRVADLSQSTFCAGCHQFNFPADPGTLHGGYATDEPMQDTYEEWAQSTSAREGVQCQGCHMPWVTAPNGRRHRTHRFPGGNDPELLRAAVRVELHPRRHGDTTTVAVTLHPGQIGHAFPTGDLFRRAELRVWLDDESHPEIVAFSRTFAPVLERSPRGESVFVRRQADDLRVMPPGTGAPSTQTVTLRGTGREVHYALDYLLMPTPLAASHGIGTPRNQVTILQGTVPLEGATP